MHERSDVFCLCCCADGRACVCVCVCLCVEGGKGGHLVLHHERTPVGLHNHARHRGMAHPGGHVQRPLAGLRVGSTAGQRAAKCLPVGMQRSVEGDEGGMLAHWRGTGRRWMSMYVCLLGGRAGQGWEGRVPWCARSCRCQPPAAFPQFPCAPPMPPGGTPFAPAGNAGAEHPNCVSLASATGAN